MLCFVYDISLTRSNSSIVFLVCMQKKEILIGRYLKEIEIFWACSLIFLMPFFRNGNPGFRLHQQLQSAPCIAAVQAVKTISEKPNRFYGSEIEEKTKSGRSEACFHHVSAAFWVIRVKIYLTECNCRWTRREVTNYVKLIYSNKTIVQMTN